MAQKSEKKSKTKISAVKNNLFALKLLCKICPKVVIHLAIRTLIDYGE